MYLKKIGIHGLRNLTSNEVSLSPTSNFFFGENGSGKTSFLEGVHVLGRGRSFRSRTLDPVINEAEDSCTVFGLIDKNNILLVISDDDQQQLIIYNFKKNKILFKIVR